jgi:PcfJ-like protein
VSRSKVLAGHHKRQTDLAMHAAYRRLAHEPASRACFEALLQAVRQRGRGLLDPAAVIDRRMAVAAAYADTATNAAQPRHPGVTALLHLARFHAQHVRALDDWPGCAGSWRVVEASLAAHLLARWPVPVFLAAAWHAADDDAWAEAKRRWYVAHAAGASFRSLDGLPITMTRAMEHVLLASKPHMDITAALRRAELLGLGAQPWLMRAVLASRVALDFRHGDFWRSVWLFFIAHTTRSDDVRAIIDFIHDVRHGDDGDDALAPPWPTFSIEGRTPASLRRLMTQWHRSLAAGELGLAWRPSGIRPLTLEQPSQDPALPPIVWTLHELTNSAQLRAEGQKLQHCVASYAHDCLHGRARVWSLGRQRGATCRPVLTIEVDPSARCIVQARGFRNQWPRGRPLDILRTWAARERLTLRL